MITIKKLNIQFDKKTIINNSDFIIPNGKLCLITSESGTGKSLLFDILSLNNNEHFVEYTFHDLSISELNDKQKLLLQENHISYVTQNALLINQLTVIDQLKLFNKNDRINELMEKLDIRELTHKKVKHLSGGERQRVAIACALLKDAELYLFDEPTAMLDEENKAAVIALIEELVQHNKMVFVATHEKEYFQDYVEYEILDNKIQAKQYFFESETPFQLLSTQTTKLKNKLALKYFFNSPSLNTLSILIMSLCFALVVGITSFCFYNDSQLDLSMNAIYESELYIVNPFFKNDFCFDSYQYPIDSATIKKIETINHVKNIYPYIPVESNYGYINDEGKIDSKSLEEVDEMVLKKGGQVINTIEYKMAFEEWIEIEGEMVPFYPNQYHIGIAYPHQQFDQKCEKVLEEDGFYITLEFASKLGLEEANGETLTLQMTVPIAASGSITSYTNEETGEWIDQKSYMNTGAFLTVELPIKGILTNPIYGNYLGSQDVHIFLNYETIVQLQEEAYQKHYDHIQQLMTTPNSSYLLKEYFDYELIADTWESSAYIIQVDHAENVNSVIEEIKRIESNLVVNITSTQYGKTGTILDDEVLKSYKTAGIVYPLIIAIASIIGIVVIHYFILKPRNKDNQFLKINGLSDYDLKGIYFRETILESILILPFASLFTYFIFDYISTTTKARLSFGFETFVVLVMLELFILAIVYHISYALVRRTSK